MQKIKHREKLKILSVLMFFIYLVSEVLRRAAERLCRFRLRCIFAICHMSRQLKC